MLTWILAFLILWTPNVSESFQPDLAIDFAPLETRPASGWFILSAGGDYAASVVDGGMMVFDTKTGDVASTYQYAIDGLNTTPLHADFAPTTDRIAALHTDGTRYDVVIYDVTTGEQTVIPYDNTPEQAAWIWWGADENAVWLEIKTRDGRDLITRLPLTPDLEPLTLESGPQNDPDALFRNGRTLAPLAVTVDRDSRLRRWNLETGAVTGSITPDQTLSIRRVNDGNGRYLPVQAVDNTLYRADFDESRLEQVAEVNAFIGLLILTPDGEQIIGIGFYNDNRVGLWDVATGAFTDLGTHRACSRPLDIARLSADGSTLVMGCDTGLDVWRLNNDDDQNDETADGPPVISRENITALTSVNEITFADAPEAAGEFQTGTVVVNADGTAYATYNTQREVVVWDDTGAVVLVEAGPGDIYDVAFSATDLIVLRGEIGRINVIRQPFDSGDPTLTVYETDGIGQEVWAGEDGSIWFEIFNLDGTTQIVNLPSDPLADAQIVPYGLEDDPDALVRVGRIPPPYAVTTSEAGVVKLWNLETNTVLDEVTVEGGPAVFGQVSPDARYFAWRDPASAQLNRLDFETGDNLPVAELDGQYVQGYFITPDGTTILGVDVDFEPLVVAWDADTGDRIDLGTYRTCSRVPDMITLSADATTLVIGCDTGLDIWRIETETEETTHDDD